MPDERTTELYARATAAREDGTNFDDVRIVGNDDSEQQPHDQITSLPRRSSKGVRFPPMCAAIRSARALPSDNNCLAPITWHLCLSDGHKSGSAAEIRPAGRMGGFDLRGQRRGHRREVLLR